MRATSEATSPRRATSDSQHMVLVVLVVLVVLRAEGACLGRGDGSSGVVGSGQVLGGGG